LRKPTMVDNEKSSAPALAPAPAPAPPVIDIRLGYADAPGNRDNNCDHQQHNVRYMPANIVRVLSLESENKEDYCWINVDHISAIKRTPDGQAQVYFNNAGQPMVFGRSVGDFLEKMYVNWHWTQTRFVGVAPNLAPNQEQLHYAVHDNHHKRTNTNPYGAFNPYTAPHALCCLATD
jgi:hypothetical protein